jgi:hypothetical protein
MKIKILANELTDTDISAVSLVKHGANRVPFKVIKAEDAPELTVGQKITKLFEPSQPANVAAIYVKKSETAKYTKILEKAGFAINCTEDGGVSVFKQEGFDEANVGTLIQINKDVAVSLNKNVINSQKETLAKSFYGGCCYPASTDFNDNVNSSMFYPGLSAATDALRDTIYAVLDGVKSPSEIDLSTALSAFGQYVSGLVSKLPESVFKIEFGSLQEEIGASSLKDTKSGDSEMTKEVKLKEGVAGDLGDLMKEESAKTPEQIAAEAKAKADADAAAVAKTAEDKAKADAEAAAVAKTAEDKAKADAVAKSTETKTVETDANAALLATLNSLNESVKKSNELQVEQAKRIEALEAQVKKSDEAAAAVLAKAEKLTVVKDHGNNDLALSSVGGRGRADTLAKSDKDMWGGVFSF